MTARLRALTCLLVFHSVCWSAARIPLAAPLVVYLPDDSTQDQAIIDITKDELSSLMASAGYQVNWAKAQASSTSGNSVALAMVELQGACGSATGIDASSEIFGSDGLPADTRLGSSVRDGERILPFVTVNCHLLNRMLDVQLGKASERARQQQFGRAVARVIAHELYHVLTESPQHTSSGLTKASFNVQDLLAEQFRFTRAALEEFHRHQFGHKATLSALVAPNTF